MLSAGILFSVAFGVLAVLNPYQYSPESVWQGAYNLLIAVGCILGWLMLSLAYETRWLVWCGVWSLGIMLMHKFPMLVVQNGVSVVRSLFQSDFVALLIGIALTFAIVMATCSLACFALFRFAPWSLGMSRKK